MATRKPISSISYNTEDFFVSVLRDLYEKHIVSSYLWIKHKGEDGDKDHIHFRLELNKSVDVMDIKKFFIEVVPDNPKPLGILNFRPSKEEDWLLYSVHDEDYLKQKYGAFERGEKLPYEWTDIHHEGDSDVETMFLRAKQSLRHSNASILKRIRAGELPMSLIQEGESVYMVRGLYDLAKIEDTRWYKHDLDIALRRLDAVRKYFAAYGCDIAFPDDDTFELVALENNSKSS